MAVVGIQWGELAHTLDSSNNFTVIVPYAVIFDTDFSGSFTIDISGATVGSLQLTKEGNGTNNFSDSVTIEASDWFNAVNNTDDTNSLTISSGNSQGLDPLVLTLDAPPVCTSLDYRSDWTDPTVFIQYLTKVTATASIEAKFGATIQSATATFVGDVTGSNSISLSQSGDVWTGSRSAPTFIGTGTGYIRVNLEDSRGVSKYYTFYDRLIIVYKHGSPTINIDTYRSDSNGDLDLGGGYIAVTAYATPNPAEFIPAISTVEVTLLDENMGTLVPAQSVANGTQVVIGSGSLSPTTAYNVSVKATDGYGGSKTKTVLLNPVKRVINVKDGGTGIAFGKLATEDALVDSAWDISSDGTVTAKNNFNAIAPNRYKQYVFSNTSGTRLGGMQYDSGDATNVTAGRIAFWEYSPKTTPDTGTSGHYELYYLPQVDTGLASTETYNILTSKIHNLSRVLYTTVSANSSKSFTVGASAFGVMFTSGAASSGNDKGLYIFNSSSGRAMTIKTIASASALTVTTATGTITVANSLTTAAKVGIVMFAGTVEVAQ